MKKTGGQAVVEALDAWGVEVVFGIPGIHTLALYDALYQHPRIQHVTARHEQGAGFMADGYARATGRVGVVLATTGPGAVNALTPLGTAYAESSPVLLIASGLPDDQAGKDLGVLHDMRDQFGVLKGVCGQGCRVGAMAEIPVAVSAAFAALQRQRPRPYVLEVPLDILEAEGEPSPPRVELGPLRAPDPAALREAAEQIRVAMRPLIVAGGGAQGAAAEVRQLAEHLRAPVGLTLNGLGILPADHPLLLGDAASPGLDPRRRILGRDLGRWMAQADLVIAVGTRMAERTVRAWDAQPGRLIHLDIDPAVIGRDFPVEVGVVTDARTGVRALLEALGEEPVRSSWPAGEFVAGDPEEGVFPAILRAVREALDRDAVLTNDMTMVCYQARRLFPVYAPRSFLSPHYYGTLGFAVPAAIGAKIGCRSRQVLALCGDGGFLFTGQELATARQQRLSLPIVLCNDNTYTAVRQAQERTFGDRYIGVDLENPDFVLLAQSFGVNGVRVTSPADLARALQEALRADLPTLIEVFLPEFVV